MPPQNARIEALRGPPLEVAKMTVSTFRAFNRRSQEISPEV